MTKNRASGVETSANVSAGLDWQAFSAAYFPGRRRHDLQAMTAYGTYRRSRSLDERQSSESAIRMEAVESGEAGSTGLQDWEDEGGATP